jgi:hypothetical protein
VCQDSQKVFGSLVREGRLSLGLFSHHQLSNLRSVKLVLISLLGHGVSVRLVLRWNRLGLTEHKLYSKFLNMNLISNRR